MELLETMMKRKSMRQYTGEDISQTELDQILQAGLLAPSSRNIQPCELIVIKDKDMLQKLSHAKTAGASMLADANCAIMVLGNAEKSDTWIEDCSLVMIYMHLMATSLRLGSCWVQCRLREAQGGISSEDYVRSLINIPQGYHLEAILALGKTDKHPQAYSLEQLKTEKIHYYETEKSGNHM